MRKLLLVLFLLFLIPSQVEAHTLKTVDTIGAVIHIDPDDEPKANITSTIFIEFHDRAGKFSFEKCNCNLSILSGGKVLLSENFQNLTLDGSSIGRSFVFPNSGVYQIKIDGKPVKRGEFKAFQIVFDQRVLPEGAVVQNADYSKYIIPSILAIAAIFMLVYYWANRK